MCSVVCSNAARLATSARPIALDAGIRHPHATASDERSVEHSANQRREIIIVPCAQVPVEVTDHKGVFGTGYTGAFVFRVRVGAAEEIGRIILVGWGSSAAYVIFFAQKTEWRENRSVYLIAAV